jgi:hypothetical protein
VRALSACDVLAIWEVTAGAGPTQRALAILARACPERSPESLAALPLGRRDGLLLELYRSTFGPALDLFERCPACGQGLALGVDADDLLAGGSEIAGDSEKGGVRELAVDGLELRFRLPTSADVDAAARAPDPAAARAVLVERLVVEARRGGAAVDPRELGEAELTRFAESLAAADPRAEVVFDLRCEACQHRWQAFCDVAECFWHQLATAARHLLREVHVLAGSYGWCEADILALAAPRRRAYLEMLAGE